MNIKNNDWIINNPTITINNISKNQEYSINLQTNFNKEKLVVYFLIFQL